MPRISFSPSLEEVLTGAYRALCGPTSVMSQVLCHTTACHGYSAQSMTVISVFLDQAGHTLVSHFAYAPYVGLERSSHTASSFLGLCPNVTFLVRSSLTILKTGQHHHC